MRSQLNVFEVQDKLSLIKKMADLQAEDEALWCQAETAGEAYMQQELRRLHQVIDSNNIEEIKKHIIYYQEEILP